MKMVKYMYDLSMPEQEINDSYQICVAIGVDVSLFNDQVE